MTVQTLKNLLDVPDTDYWYDSGFEIARTFLDESYDELLVALLKEWKEWPEHIQENLAYILGEGSSLKEIELINALIGSKYEAVVYRANEALLEFKHKKE